jgi:enoyl-CoA hydratase
METKDLLVDATMSARRLRLNRPKALNALTHDMCLGMTEALLRWRREPGAEVVLIDHLGERGFCAGGDIRTLSEAPGEGPGGHPFFFDEYRLNHLLAEYPKPVVAVMDGITMGGGAGISLPARYRIATERTVFAMPETAIGFVPDVGGGWWLPRLPGEGGMWLALTGARAKGGDCVRLGIATHYVESGRVEALKAALLAHPHRLEAVLAEFACPLPGSAVDQTAIDRLFGAETLESVINRLKADGSPIAAEALEALAARCPLSVKVTFRQQREGRRLASFADELATEYRVASRMIRLPNFKEGVRAVIVDKDNRPRWIPPTLREVRDAEVEALFAPFLPEEEWTPLTMEETR